MDLKDVGMGWFDCCGRAGSCSWRCRGCRGLFDCDWGHCGGVDVEVVVVMVMVRWDVVTVLVQRGVYKVVYTEGQRIEGQLGSGEQPN